MLQSINSKLTCGGPNLVPPCQAGGNARLDSNRYLSRLPQKIYENRHGLETIGFVASLWRYSAKGEER